MSVAELLVLILATYRITNLIVDDSEGGPRDILHALRYYAGIRYDEKKRMFGTNTISRAMACFFCFSFWAGLFVALIALIPGRIGFFILLPFALSGGAILIKKWSK